MLQSISLRHLHKLDPKAPSPTSHSLKNPSLHPSTEKNEDFGGKLPLCGDFKEKEQIKILPSWEDQVQVNI